MSWTPDGDTPDGRMELMSREAAENPEIIALGGGLPAPETMPRAALGRAFGALLADQKLGDQALQYGWPEGHGPLREFITARLRARGISLHADDLIITSGAQQALSIASRCLMRDSVEKRIHVDEVTYPGALELFRDRGFGVTTSPAPVAYVLPALSLPMGLRMAQLERDRLLADSDCTFIEDDAYAELVFDGVVPRPLAADARERTWHVGTFSKVLCPGLRVGWLVPPPDQARAALEAKRETDLQTSGLSQCLTAVYLQQEDYDARLMWLQRFYKQRAEVLMQAVETHLPQWKFRTPEGGYSLWLLPDAQVDESELMACALEEGMNFDPGSQFRANAAAAPLALRLCFSFNPNAQLEEGVQRLARAWRKLISRA